MPLYAPFWGSKSPGGSLIRKYLNTKRREKQYCSLTSNNVNVRWASVIEENDQESWRRNKLIVKGLRTNFHHFNVPCPLLTRWRQFLWGLRSDKFPPQIDSSLHKIHLTSEFMTPSKTRWYIYCMVNKKSQVLIQKNASELPPWLEENWFSVAEWTIMLIPGIHSIPSQDL